MALKIYTEPAEEPIFVDDITKAHLRVTSDADDTIIGAYIKAARIHCENFQNRAYITQTWDYFLDGFPSENYIKIPLPPLQSVLTLKYKDTAGTLQTWAATNYIVDTKSSPGRICLAYGISWPTTYGEVQDVQIQFTCGYGLSALVPQNIKIAIMLKLMDLYEHRGDTGVSENIDNAIEALLWPDRIVPV